MEFIIMKVVNGNY